MMPEIREISKILADLASADEVEKFLYEVLTDNERRDLSLRWELMKKLYAGVPQRSIASELGISLCKITRGSKILKSGDSVTGRILASLAGNDESKTR